jgi:hypothetical protein
MKTDDADNPGRGIPGRMKSRFRTLLLIRAESCPNAELLDGYVHGELTGREHRRIEGHVVWCPACVSAVEALREADAAEIETPSCWQSAEKRLDGDFYARLGKASVPGARSAVAESGKPEPAGGKTAWRDVVASLLGPRRLAAAASLACAVVVVLYSAAYLGRGHYFELARIQPERLPQMRAVSEDDGFNEGMRRYNRGDYKKAADLLAGTHEAEPDNYAACYYLGLSYLARAESGLPGLPFRFDQSDVEKGVEMMTAALALAGGNAYYRADCLWYLGKARLMQGMPGEARTQFLRCRELEGMDSSRPEEARNMLRRMR